MANKDFEGRGNWKHGAWTRSPILYNVWRTMIHRCEDPTYHKFPIYGGRGITVCRAWHDPHKFMDWAEANGYRPGLQIDRMDNSRGYSPSNCRWTTAKEQARNTRRNVFLTIGGTRQTVAAWAEQTGIRAGTIYRWVTKFGKRETARRVAGNPP